MADAWDDDWINKADVCAFSFESYGLTNKLHQSKPATPDPAPASTKLSKAERRAKQAEFNRQIWEDAYVYDISNSTTADYIIEARRKKITSFSKPKEWCRSNPNSSLQ